MIDATYYERLDSRSRHTYDVIVADLRSMSPRILADGVDEDMLQDILRNRPELFYVSQQFAVAYSLLGRSIQPSYLYPREQASQIAGELARKVEEVVRERINDHQSDYDKVLVLHDYLACTAQYDDEAAAANDRMVARDPRIAESHTVVGPLLRGKAVCSGFAKAMKMLCDRVGVKCCTIGGTASNVMSSGPHAWNMVCLGGRWHHVDVTWDNQFSMNGDIPNYGYLNVDDETMSRDHRWERSLVPTSPDDPYNYFRMNDSLVDGRVQLERLLKDRFDTEEPFVLFKVKRDSPFAQKIGSDLNEIVYKAASQCRYTRLSGFRCESIPEQLVFDIQPVYH